MSYWQYLSLIGQLRGEFFFPVPLNSESLIEIYSLMTREQCHSKRPWLLHLCHLLHIDWITIIRGPWVCPLSNESICSFCWMESIPEEVLIPVCTGNLHGKACYLSLVPPYPTAGCVDNVKPCNRSTTSSISMYYKSSSLISLKILQWKWLSYWKWQVIKNMLIHCLC